MAIRSMPKPANPKILENTNMSKSLETLLLDLTSAVDELTKAITSAASGSGKAVVAKAAATEETEEKPKPAPRKPAAAKPAKAPTVAAMKKAGEAFLDATDEPDEYAARRAFLKKTVAKYDAPKLTEIGEDDRAAALADLEGFEFTPAEEDDDSDI